MLSGTKPCLAPQPSRHSGTMPTLVAEFRNSRTPGSPRQDIVHSSQQLHTDLNWHDDCFGVIAFFAFTAPCSFMGQDKALAALL
ncbi:uncharacterized protein TrAFT101_004751 [Trichoderma asperellum]|uniref:uncharacterized protein n=1 Tax=Trichoderma asperellum TaxID=101201 RepID=UPI00332FBBAD|nr:hypothetical protein TrAFT101_004751 [Trichoderma asperellum]